MTDKNKAALEALDEWKISRATGNPDIEHEKAKTMESLVRAALTPPAEQPERVTEAKMLLDKSHPYANGWNECVRTVATYPFGLRIIPTKTEE
jgi:hypothetical protein